MDNYKKVILDASAVIAFLKKENGYMEVQEVIHKAVISSINATEIAKYIHSENKLSIEDTKKIIDSIFEEIVPFNGEQIYMNASLVSQTKRYGLSLGDRACIALGQITGYPVYTTDRIWKEIGIPNVDIRLIR
ncbi:MAG: PIN domain-containing protein [Rickettsiales bacterium]|nr:MAG: PIN domain-containing protein [Rickettsiales bacterium]